jgi:stearoyl-CoA desaturase (delta-9 desaturase)
MLDAPRAADHEDIVYPAAIPFALVHLACFAAIFSGVTLKALALGAALYWLRIFAIGAGYHRYFSHKSYSTGRVFQFVLAVLSQMSAQNSVLWWASKHRHHHLFSDTEHDVHSAKRRGFFYSHVGWIFDRRHRGTDLVKVEDLCQFPELRFLHRFEYAPAGALAVLCFVLAGWPGLVVGFFWSTVLVYHSTFCINSLAHMHGARRYVTGDGSRNNWLLAFFTMGEGWHNNHHACQSSVRQGFRWWEYDPTYYILWTLSKLGVVWDLKTPSKDILANEHRIGQRTIERAAEQLAHHFRPELTARSIAACAKAGAAASSLAAGVHWPVIPTREEFLTAAKKMFDANTRSLDEIIDRAYELFASAVHARLGGPPTPA